ncbi:hypothetical protein SAMN06297468_2513 [Altererythrobacter xiamenensis]|uniref:Uncharacterized protein n=1 Tax=Altererythrobacter xiamenensis TaxID=1316679 RepID=A0A1Y6FN44_9SPHN|nr:hypothetical protein [Altererythrobacter xiamenensis]SMQ74282.1 hypothetical protein SAMN06297468_2513 [Altererythrobacter xiamenensis]
MKLNEAQFVEATRAVAQTVLDAFEAYGFERDDAANVAGAAMAEIIARQIGPYEACERLRDVADKCEKQVLGEIGVD